MKIQHFSYLINSATIYFVWTNTKKTIILQHSQVSVSHIINCLLKWSQNDNRKQNTGGELHPAYNDAGHYIKIDA